jgi:hypothetical protein
MFFSSLRPNQAGVKNQKRGNTPAEKRRQGFAVAYL